MPAADALAAKLGEMPMRLRVTGIQREAGQDILLVGGHVPDAAMGNRPVEKKNGRRRRHGDGSIEHLDCRSMFAQLAQYHPERFDHCEVVSRAINGVNSVVAGTDQAGGCQVRPGQQCQYFHPAGRQGQRLFGKLDGSCVRAAPEVNRCQPKQCRRVGRVTQQDTLETRLGRLEIADPQVV